MAERSIVSVYNTSTTPLAANATYTGNSESVIDYRSLGVIVIASHISATNGLKIQFSTDGTNWDLSRDFTIDPNEGRFFNYPTEAQYFRVTYTNGPNDQTYFRLQCLLHPSQAKEITANLQDDIDYNTACVIARSVTSGRKSDGSFINIDATDDNRLKVSTNISGQIVTISGNVVNISGQPVIISGNIVQVTNLSGQTLSVNISGIIVSISGATLITTVSGEPVTVSGNIVQVVNASGQCLCANVSGNVVNISGQPVTISGNVVNISGQPVTVSGNIQVVNASGQCLCTNISGQSIIANPNSEFLLEVARGNISGISLLEQFGNNGGVGNTLSDIWGQGGLKIYPSVAAVGTVKSTNANDKGTDPAGTGARTVRVYGLDSNYNLINELKILNGTSNVTTANSYIRIYRMEVESAGSGEENAGDITITIGGNVQEFIEASENRSQSSHYTIPAGKIGYLHDIYFVTTTAGSMERSAWCREINQVFHMLRQIYLFQDVFHDTVDYAIKFTEKTDVVLRVKGASGSDHKISGGYRILLINN